jgi:hypothetical protein
MNAHGFRDPEGQAALYLYLYRNPLNLDLDSYSRFVSAREKNVFADYDGYLETGRLLENSGRPVITKKLTDEGVSVEVESGYLQQDGYIFVFDFWAYTGETEPYRKLIHSILSSATVQADAGTEPATLPEGEEKSLVNEYFQVAFPVYWMVGQTYLDESFSTTLTSPDERAVVQLLVISDDQGFSKSVVSDLVLDYLGDKYARDLLVSSYRALPEGREEISWLSFEGKYQGTTTYESHGRVLWIVTAIWDTEQSDGLKAVVEPILSSILLITPEGN